MKQALILHGTDASPGANWFTWVKVELEKEGYIVWLPQLPNSERPNTRTYNEFLLSNTDFEFTNETIVIGHSSGAVEILSLLQNIPKEKRIKAAFLVSAFKDWLGWESLNDLFIEPLDFELIKSRADGLTFIHSDNDPYCPIEHPQYLAKHLNAELVILPGQGHFNTELNNSYKAFPKLLDIIKSSV